MKFKKQYQISWLMVELKSKTQNMDALKYTYTLRVFPVPRETFQEVSPIPPTFITKVVGMENFRSIRILLFGITKAIFFLLWSKRLWGRLMQINSGWQDRLSVCNIYSHHWTDYFLQNIFIFVEIRNPGSSAVRKLCWWITKQQDSVEGDFCATGLGVFWRHLTLFILIGVVDLEKKYPNTQTLDALNIWAFW